MIKAFISCLDMKRPSPQDVPPEFLEPTNPWNRLAIGWVITYSISGVLPKDPEESAEALVLINDIIVYTCMRFDQKVSLCAYIASQHLIMEPRHGSKEDLVGRN
jgi:hypothetical protein